MVGRNFIAKKCEDKRFRLKIACRYREIVKQNDMVSLSYDVNDHVYSKSKPIYFVV